MVELEKPTTHGLIPRPKSLGMRLDHSEHCEKSMSEKNSIE